MKINKSFQNWLDSGCLRIGGREKMTDWLYINFVGVLVAVDGG